MVWVVSRFRLTAPPGISSSCISPLTSSGRRSRASWASQPKKSATLSPQPGGKPRKFIRTCGGIGGEIDSVIINLPGEETDAVSAPRTPGRQVQYPDNTFNLFSISFFHYSSHYKLLYVSHNSTHQRRQPIGTTCSPAGLATRLPTRQHTYMRSCSDRGLSAIRVTSFSISLTICSTWLSSDCWLSGWCRSGACRAPSLCHSTPTIKHQFYQFYLTTLTLGDLTTPKTHSDAKHSSVLCQVPV